MDEIFGIEEEPVFTSNVIQDPLNNNNHDHGHLHENNIKEIEKWIVETYIKHINISVDVEEYQNVYQNNKSTFHHVLSGLLIFIMIYILYSIFKSIYNFWDESTKIRILRQLENKRNMRKAE